MLVFDEPGLQAGAAGASLSSAGSGCVFWVSAGLTEALAVLLCPPLPAAGPAPVFGHSLSSSDCYYAAGNSTLLSWLHYKCDYTHCAPGKIGVV